MTIRRAVAALAWISGAALPLLAQEPDRLARLAGAFPEVDRSLRAFVAARQVPGAGWGIIVDGKLVHVTVTGLRDVEAGAPVDSTSVFRIASMTKSFTALAILRLRDEGRLSLDDPAEKYLPELAGLRYPTTDSPRITIRHLMSHSAGFPEDNPWGDQQLSRTEAEMTAMLRAGIPFSNAPGLAYEYSNYGFAMLGRIVSRVAGVPYADYIRRTLLVPLGMRVTTLQAAEVAPARQAHGYRRQDGRWLEEPQLPDGAFGAMGGMLTSISDLGRYVAFMLDAWPPRDDPDNGPVRRASVREMQQLARYAGATVVRDSATGTVALNAGGYGFGLRVAQTCLFPASVSHTGGLPGFGSLMRWLPEYGVGIVALGNLTYTGWTAAVEQAFGILARSGGLVPRAPAPAPILLERRRQVSRLVMEWSDPLADSLAAMNLFLDESKDRRKAAMARLRDGAGGGCAAQGPFEVENALRGRWRMRCATGDLRVSITLAPTLPATVQFLEVTPLGREEGLAPLPACRAG